MTRLSSNFGWVIISALALMLLSTSLACAGPSVSLDPPPAENAKGRLLVSFLYLPPTGEIEPTYHTVIWLADQSGKLLRTLYVSQDLSDTEYKLEAACKEWVKQADWAKADKALVDAVTGPTPNVGSGALEFLVQDMGIAPGVYQLRFEVNVAEGYDILFLAKLNLGGAANVGKTEVFYNPEKAPGDVDYVRDVEAQYIP
jgi:hypothetical protein